MRDIKRRIPTDRPRMSLRRTADGRLKPAAADADIADIWAEQKRIQLKEAIEAQNRKALKKQRRKEGGLFAKRSASRPQDAAPGSPNATAKEIEIRLSLPKVHLPHPADVLERAQAVLAPLVRTRRRVFTLVGVAVVVLGLIGLQAVGSAKKHDKLAKDNATKTAVLSASQQAQAPDFKTVLPIDKKIEDLGGWGRVSPAGAAPAFAYSDTLSSVHIVVTEQELPDDFASDIPAHLAKTAKQFNASKKLTTTEGSDVYVGTAANGSQSVVTSKNGLLILLRSTSGINDQIWSDYVYSLE
ncbi:MAG TPA: hypothetical protein VLF62_00215 [Candidatus Saccharimonadales bacterium]|nr:hypothetical protein [Candidatus Saccharimonadales bacterium]